MARVSFPIDLGAGLEVDDASVKRYFEGVERGGGGFFPLGSSGTWHGGVHLYADAGAMVHAMADGWVVACRLQSDPEALKGPFGSTNFILMRHEDKGRTFNRVAPAKDLKSREVYTWFSLYMHLGPLEAVAATAELAETTWLGTEVEGEIVGSVGRGGRNRRADVKLVQEMLTRAKVDPGPIDGLIGSKTRAGIKAFQEKFLYSNPDGRIDVGGSSWAALLFAAAGAPKDHGFDETLLGQIASGNLVLCEKPVGAGDPLWIVGPDADGETQLVHWEVFSGDNVLNGVPEASDESAFQADPHAIASTLKGPDWFTTDAPTPRNIARFYASNAAAKGLREMAVRFRSEWGLDMQAAIKAMEPYVLTEGLAEQIKPYQWFDPNTLAAVNVPDPLCWHYHPVRFTEHLSQMYSLRALPVYPPRPPQADDLPDSDDEAPDAPDEGIMLYDSGTDLVYILSKSEYERVVRDNAKLRGKKQALEAAMKAAKDLSPDQRANAVRPQLEELVELTNTGNNTVTNFGDINQGSTARSVDWVSEMWIVANAGGKRPLFVAPITKARIERKAKEVKPIKEMFKPQSKGVEFKFELIDDDMKKKYPWLQGGGSLLDFIDSANPGLLGRFLGPMTGIDAFFEKYPRLFRKGYNDKWESKSGNLSASAEARLLRWGYETKLGGVFSPKDGKAEFRGTLGGSVDLISGKCQADWFIPKAGFALPLTVGDELKMRFHLKGEVAGSVGMAAQLSAGAAVQYKPDEKDNGFYGARADAGIELFAGAKVTGKLTFGVEWFNEGKWCSLAQVWIGGTAIAGVALVAKFVVDFDFATGIFVLYIKAQIAVKLGVGLEYGLEIHAFELVKFLWALLTRADWGKIAELSFDAFMKASEMMVAAAIQGTPVGALTYALVSGFNSWWSDQGKVTQMAENILNGRASVLLKYGSPEAKGMAINRLCDASWMWDETAETAALKVLKSAKSRREVEKVLKSVDPDGRDPNASWSKRNAARTVERGYDLMSGLVDWGEQDALDNFLISKGINI